MREIWNAINRIENWDQFVEWYHLQSDTMQIFLGLVGFGVVYVIIVLILYLIPFGSD